VGVVWICAGTAPGWELVSSAHFPELLQPPSGSACKVAQIPKLTGVASSSPDLEIVSVRKLNFFTRVRDIKSSIALKAGFVHVVLKIKREGGNLNMGGGMPIASFCGAVPKTFTVGKVVGSDVLRHKAWTAKKEQSGASPLCSTT
jgi:hypothetical protein